MNISESKMITAIVEIATDISLSSNITRKINDIIATIALTMAIINKNALNIVVNK